MRIWIVRKRARKRAKHARAHTEGERESTYNFIHHGSSNGGNILNDFHVLGVQVVGRLESLFEAQVIKLGSTNVLVLFAGDNSRISSDFEFRQSSRGSTGTAKGSGGKSHHRLQSGRNQENGGNHGLGGGTRNGHLCCLLLRYRLRFWMVSGHTSSMKAMMRTTSSFENCCFQRNNGFAKVTMRLLGEEQK